MNFGVCGPDRQTHATPFLNILNIKAQVENSLVTMFLNSCKAVQKHFQDKSSLFWTVLHASRGSLKAVFKHTLPNCVDGPQHSQGNFGVCQSVPRRGRRSMPGRGRVAAASATTWICLLATTRIIQGNYSLEKADCFFIE